LNTLGGTWLVGGYDVVVSDRGQMGGPNINHWIEPGGCVYDYSKWYKLGRTSGDVPMVMELAYYANSSTVAAGYPNGWSKNNHGAGYNIGFFDGSVSWYPDLNDITETHFAQGSLPPAGTPSSTPIPYTLMYLVNQGRWWFDPAGSAAANSTPTNPVQGGGNWGTGLAWIEHYWMGWSIPKLVQRYPSQGNSPNLQ
jgi:prepilin-type processing-associated H-X9-DG protein